MNLDPLIRACQRAAGVVDDGKPGPKTWAAIFFKLTGQPWSESPKLAPDGEQVRTRVAEAVDDRSEASIATLLPEVRSYARALVHGAAAQGITIKVISGTRTYAEQDALYAQGRTKRGPVVTNARGGYSNHNFGIAFDIGVFNGAKYVEESPLYKVIGSLGTSLGLTWGGNWRTSIDEPHFQLRPAWAREMSERDMVAELRRRKSKGSAVFA